VQNRTSNSAGRSLVLIGRAALIAITACVFVSAGLAQSGRKLPTWNTPTPTPTPTPTDDSTKEKKDEKKPKLPLIVTKYSSSVSLSSGWTDLTVGSCMDRLHASSMVTVSHEADMNRKQASDRAKKETEAYVVWMELDSESEVSPMGGGNPYRYYLNYVVYTPGTAKIKTSGRVYQSEVRANNGPVGPASGPGAAEYRLRLVGEEAADRILSALAIAPIPRNL
jgi:hypothetical protein